MKVDKPAADLFAEMAKWCPCRFRWEARCSHTCKCHLRTEEAAPCTHKFHTALEAIAESDAIHVEGCECWQALEDACKKCGGKKYRRLDEECLALRAACKGMCR